MCIFTHIYAYKMYMYDARVSFVCVSVVYVPHASVCCMFARLLLSLQCCRVDTLGVVT